MGSGAVLLLITSAGTASGWAAGAPPNLELHIFSGATLALNGPMGWQGKNREYPNKPMVAVTSPKRPDFAQPLFLKTSDGFNLTISTVPARGMVKLYLGWMPAG